MAKNSNKREHAAWTPPNAVQIHVALDGIAPAIWRRLVVPLTATLADLHHILQAAMGWKDAHLHQFEMGGLMFGDLAMLDCDKGPDDARSFDSSDVRLKDFHFYYGEGPVILYHYDFGDGWRHTVKFEALLAEDPAPKTATCTEGARCCPPEDVGGLHGYFEFARILLSPAPDEREEQRHLKRWSGGKFEPERFDLAKTDKAVRRVAIKR
jgi:hypothetical protein